MTMTMTMTMTMNIILFNINNVLFNLYNGITIRIGLYIIVIVSYYMYGDHN